MQGKLSELIEAARAARNANSKADFDEDPAALAGKPSEVDSISGELTSSEADYAMGLWKTWLASYGYEVASGWANAYSKDPHPLSQRSQPIRTAIVEVFGSEAKAREFVMANSPT